MKLQSPPQPPRNNLSLGDFMAGYDSLSIGGWLLVGIATLVALTPALIGLYLIAFGHDYTFTTLVALFLPIIIFFAVVLGREQFVIIPASRKKFWKSVARYYGFTYHSYVRIDGEQSLLFKAGEETGKAYNCLEGQYRGIAFRFFEYSFIDTRRAHMMNYNVHAFEIPLSGRVPHMQLVYRYDHRVNASNLFGQFDSTRITLEEVFSEYFTLYALSEYEIEALAIFSPEILQYLIDIDWQYHIELVDGELLVYTMSPTVNAQAFEEDFIKFQKFIDKLRPLLERQKIYPIGDLSYRIK